VLLLLRFVQSPQSREEPKRRQTVMRLSSDLAPSWTVPDLIALLADEDAEMRVFVATALQRLTCLDQGRPPTPWQDDLEKCAATLERWQKCWTNNRRHHPSSPMTDSTSVESASDI
jgi:hypothetical protein